ncbi:MAG: helix-turn-helix transcriptional regulator [Fusobacterium sp.]|uniref:helix-turn-helix domain-containing protein n=1 Tax=Fusobacterium sp. TaxID=68766 RepID=UPI0026DAB0B8|nr:helix-turn-helix transcriptional regulator [Fusobacterium sp.]MDO4690144.1 helix-turn-helix transcriptional regulator [Fusobacterium sp.]
MKENKTEKRREQYEKKLGIFLKKVRTKRKLSLRVVGEKADMNFTYLSHLETHNREKAKLPSVEILNKLFTVYKLDLKERVKFLEIYFNLVIPEIYIYNLNTDKIKDIIKILEA